MKYPKIGHVYISVKYGSNVRVLFIEDMEVTFEYLPEGVSDHCIVEEFNNRYKPL